MAESGDERQDRKASRFGSDGGAGIDSYLTMVECA